MASVAVAYFAQGQPAGRIWCPGRAGALGARRRRGRRQTRQRPLPLLRRRLLKTRVGARSGVYYRWLQRPPHCACQRPRIPRAPRRRTRPPRATTADADQACRLALSVFRAQGTMANVHAQEVFSEGRQRSAPSRSGFVHLRPLGSALGDVRCRDRRAKAVEQYVELRRHGGGLELGRSPRLRSSKGTPAATPADPAVIIAPRASEGVEPVARPETVSKSRSPF